MIDEFEDEPRAWMSVIDAWGALGESFNGDGFSRDALQAFERRRALVDASGYPSMSPAVDLAHIRLVAHLDRPETLARAARLLEIQAADFDARGVVLPVERFGHAQAAAFVAARRDDPAAGDFARLALSLTEDRSDPVPRHPGFGTVRFKAREIDDLRVLSERYPSDAGDGSGGRPWVRAPGSVRVGAVGRLAESCGSSSVSSPR